MAHTNFRVEVLTPEGQVFNDEVELVSTRTAVGSIGILAHHAPVLAMLEPTELRLYKTESEVVRFAQAEGYMQVTGDDVMLLVEACSRPSASSRRPATTPSGDGSRSGTSAAGRRSSKWLPADRPGGTMLARRAGGAVSRRTVSSSRW